MAVPKSRWSKARSRRARANRKLTAPNLVPCPQCRQLKMPHRVCKACGSYKGREIIAQES